MINLLQFDVTLMLTILSAKKCWSIVIEFA